jgi:hypothetical protein
MLAMPDNPFALPAHAQEFLWLLKSHISPDLQLSARRLFEPSFRGTIFTLHDNVVEVSHNLSDDRLETEQKLAHFAEGVAYNLLIMWASRRYFNPMKRY